jgi:hypothetical protein
LNAALKNCQVVNSFWLKLIALVTMTIDHTAAALVCGAWYLPMRCIGRIAFPIYCFLLVEGFFHTENRKKYLLRIFLLFLVSEPFYDLTLNNALPYWWNQNILLTLTIGLGTIWLVDAMDGFLSKVGGELTGRGRSTILWALKLLVCFLGLCLSEVTMADYGCGGILLILSFYFFRQKPVRLSIAVLISLVFFIGFIEIYAMIAMIPILLYNGQRGTLLGGRAMQYAFYLYYPLHIAVLMLIKFALYGLHL